MITSGFHLDFKIVILCLRCNKKLHDSKILTINPFNPEAILRLNLNFIFVFIFVISNEE